MNSSRTTPYAGAFVGVVRLNSGAAATRGLFQLGASAASLAGSALNPVGERRAPSITLAPAGFSIQITAWRTSPSERRVGRERVASVAPPRSCSHRPGRSFHDPERGFADRLKALAFVVTAHRRLQIPALRHSAARLLALRVPEQRLSAVPLAHEHGRGGFRSVEKIGVCRV